MQITNKFNLPLPIVEAVKAQEHKGADYSVTELLQPPQLTTLKKFHADKLTEDASERVWSLFGSALHHVLDVGNKEAISEGYLTADIGGVKVSGTADLYDGETITDYKVTSVWTIIYKSRLDEWTKQLNAYDYLFTNAGFAVKNLQVVALLRDWSKTDALRDPNYPQSQVVVIPLELKPTAETKKWMTKRVLLLEELKSESERRIAEENGCTKEDRWESETKYAVMKKGRKSAVKLFEDADLAAQAVKDGLGDTVQTRPGVPRRCLDYCPVREFCVQFKSIQEAANADN